MTDAIADRSPQSPRDDDAARSPGSCVAAVDIGGTGTRVRLSDGRTTSEVVRAPGRTVTAAGIDADALLAGLTSALDTLRAAHPHFRVEALGVGMSGLLGLTAQPSCLPGRLAALFGAPRVVLASDMVTSYVGALGMRPGAVVAAGTGAVALGTDFRERWLRSDGWGHLLGDEGSGAWIGCAGLRAAMRAHDRRTGGSALLLELAAERFGEPAGLPGRLYPHGDVAGRMAAFAPDVARAAHRGDGVARGIWRRAAEHLAHTVSAALPPGEPPVVSWCGQLFSAGDLLTDPFLEALRHAAPRARPVPPAGSALDGAARLARQAVERPGELPDMAPYIRSLPPVSPPPVSGVSRARGSF
ncbi:BadF/BadG/BcrA/BcrD ATPase family protein [Streptomyces sp. NPDC050392]|uniref:N-acetylglucosamine kinase n=1 Tax=Streptomyces sp. NPDC050392 TaxID=3155782 RepID=UPI00342EF417